MLKDFKAFILRGNVVDLAVGVIIGAAFGKIVSSLVSDILMPPIGLLLGGIDFSNKFLTLRAGTAAVDGTYASIAAAKADKGAVILSYGLFVNAVVEFAIIAFCVYLLVQQVNRLFPKKVTTKDCPQCASSIPLAALRCPHCTSQLSLA